LPFPNDCLLLNIAFEEKDENMLAKFCEVDGDEK
jgi:hypothetical protein